jgi:subtilase family serine protease
MTRSIQQACRLAAAGLAGLPLLALAVGNDVNSPTTPGADLHADAQGSGMYAAPANVFVPSSSVQHAADAGHRAHTNYYVKNVRGVQAGRIEDLAMPAPEDNPAPNATFAEYPASLSCVYKMGPQYTGCAPTNNSAYNAQGGNRAIALVVAYDDPTAASDFKAFSTYFGLPLGNFSKVYANGNGNCSVPPFDSGWALEAAMDTQWAHSMAPKARIILVEACSNSYTDLMYAEQVAEQQVLAYGGGEVSNSWSSGEWSTESGDWDWVFRSNWTAGKPITFFFSAGDAGLGAQYPSSSPWVTSAGGTTINRDPNTQAFMSESCWAGSGGGTSLYETYSSSFGSGTGPWTNYQYPIFGQASRRTPDMSFDADPASGAWVQYAGSWYVVGGTSLSSPSLAGVVNNSNNQLGIAPRNGGYYANLENDLIYAELQTNKEYYMNFYDVTTGSNGASAGVGWDYCTGVGSPRGKLGK